MNGFLDMHCFTCFAHLNPRISVNPLQHTYRPRYCSSQGFAYIHIHWWFKGNFRTISGWFKDDLWSWQNLELALGFLFFFWIWIRESPTNPCNVPSALLLPCFFLSTLLYFLSSFPSSTVVVIDSFTCFTYSKVWYTQQQQPKKGLRVWR